MSIALGQTAYHDHRLTVDMVERQIGYHGLFALLEYITPEPFSQLSRGTKIVVIHHGALGRPCCPARIGKSHQVFPNIEFNLGWIRGILLDQILESIDSLFLKQLNRRGGHLLIYRAEHAAAQELLH